MLLSFATTFNLFSMKSLKVENDKPNTNDDSYTVWKVI